MPTISKPSLEDLTALKNEATENGKLTEQEWQAKFCQGMARMLRQDAKQYRCFGPWWWIMKAALIERNITVFGTHLDAEWLENMNYSDATLNLLGAFAYYNYSHSTGLIYSNIHSISFDDGESGEYTLADDEMETLIR